MKNKTDIVRLAKTPHLQSNVKLTKISLSVSNELCGGLAKVHHCRDHNVVSPRRQNNAASKYMSHSVAATKG